MVNGVLQGRVSRMQLPLLSNGLEVLRLRRGKKREFNLVERRGQMRLISPEGLNVKTSLEGMLVTLTPRGNAHCQRS